LRTIKEVAVLSGVSVRTLQYYDEIGLLKPAKVTGAGYRLYDEESINTLQQILLFKELEFPLKDIKRIMENPNFNKKEALSRQKTLLKAKRDRLNRLLDLIGRLEQGETYMSFKEFDLSEYIQALEKFKKENTEEIMKYWGSTAAFDEFIKVARDHESSIAQTAVEYYGSVEKYTDAMKESLSHFSENMENMEKMQKIKEKGCVEKNKDLIEQLTSNVSRDVKSDEIQNIIGQMLNLLDEEDQPTMDLGENYYDKLIDGYPYNPKLIEAMDQQYCKGVSKFIGEALQYYLKKKPCNSKFRII
jgi:DNA-binding transcriptional MerR regulator